MPDLSPAVAARPMPLETGWFQQAVFYEVLVQAFFDSNGDGYGDLPGLTAKLDYLQWLGVDCLWLPPFYDSPRRDGGYDVRDYYRVDPRYGTLDDFVTLLDEAHARGLRVITDLVLNHTSDQHEWFQQSRRDPDGPFGDFYVWRDNDAGYSGVRVIFEDVETSNWTFDPVRGQYFWHRFYSHQPDLNYENPAVQTAMLDVVRFWLAQGIDGFRLDAVPYLFEAEGTDCAGLPATHDYLKRVRALIDTEFPGRIMLAEANLPPKRLLDYFGDPTVGGDECHLAFHFPLMPRLYLALHQADRTPLVEVLADTPPIPAGCQWGTFLRNHDELTLEMVTEAEKAVMHESYAPEPRTRLNGGIRRRLAPLLGDDTRVTLLTALLLSLPGAPVLYYGDEIGMGDNTWLADRDGVRLPMQWSQARNGGFSTADQIKLHLPIDEGLTYGYPTVNVERQRATPGSLLHATRSLLAARHASPALRGGAFEELGGTNAAVLAFLRVHAEEAVLCLHNLSPDPQATALSLGDRFAGLAPVPLPGGAAFPGIAAGAPYALSLPGHGHLWLRLTPAAAPAIPVSIPGTREPTSDETLPA